MLHLLKSETGQRSAQFLLAIVAGKGGTIGVGLVEVYNVQ